MSEGRRTSRPLVPTLGSIAVVRVAGEDGVGAVELFEGDNEGEFVLEGEGAEGPEEVGGVEQ